MNLRPFTGNSRTISERGRASTSENRPSFLSRILRAADRLGELVILEEVINTYEDYDTFLHKNLENIV